MLNRIVLFRRKPGVAEKPELEQSLVQCLRELGLKVPGLRTWKVSANEAREPASWDYVLESRFEDERALDGYLHHPARSALLSLLTTYFDSAACDYTLEAR